ncbi:MAG: protein translocase subunit SecF [Patescibacteria group bacterium]|nr:protein translocase subunit SecF [Patescibacteria group bacterium]
MNIIAKNKIWFTLSSILVGLSILALIVWGLKPGVDFTGGSLMRLEFSKERLTNEQIEKALSDFSPNTEENNAQETVLGVTDTENSEKYGKVTIQKIGEREVILKLKAMDEKTHQKALKKIKEKTAEVQEHLAEDGKELVAEVKFDSIGPSIGKELREKSKVAGVIVLLAIIAFIAWAFRGVSSQINKYESFRYGIVAIIALMHDILITLGLFAVLGHFSGVEIDTFFIAALLTILGYSVNDTIVILDRIRENVLKSGDRNFGEVVNKSVNETLVRSINTSMTTLAVLTCILFFGGQSTFYFVLALMAGIISGTYSSIFLASPLLVWWKQRKG